MMTRRYGSTLFMPGGPIVSERVNGRKATFWVQVTAPGQCNQPDDGRHDARLLQQ